MTLVVPFRGASRCARGRAASMAVLILVACSAGHPSGALAVDRRDKPTPVRPRLEHPSVHALALDVDHRPTSTTASTPPKRPVTIAFAGDVHFESFLAPRLDHPAYGAGTDGADPASGRPVDRQPRDGRHDSRRAAAQGVHLQGAAGCVHRAEGGRRRCHHDGQQPRARLRTGERAGCARGGRARARCR